MKVLKPILLVMSVLSITLSYAQQQAIKIGAGLGGVPYEGTPGLNVELQYERTFGAWPTLFVALGMNGDNFTVNGRSTGSSNGETWDNSYQYSYNERFVYVDIGLTNRLLRLGKVYELRLAAGISAAQSRFNYPETLFINRGIITEREDTKHRVGVLMFNCALENNFKLGNNFTLGLKGALRSTFKEIHVLERVVNYEFGQSSSTSGILNIPTITLQMGYSF